MGTFEIKIKTKRSDITDQIDMSTVNDCIIHGHKPKFVLLEAVRNKTNKLMTVRCDSEECSRCCDGYYGPNPKAEIVQIWNKFNPKPAQI